MFPKAPTTMLPGRNQLNVAKTTFTGRRNSSSFMLLGAFGGYFIWGTNVISPSLVLGNGAGRVGRFFCLPFANSSHSGPLNRFWETANLTTQHSEWHIFWCPSKKSPVLLPFSSFFWPVSPESLPLNTGYHMLLQHYKLSVGKKFDFFSSLYFPWVQSCR